MQPGPAGSTQWLHCRVAATIYKLNFVPYLTWSSSTEPKHLHFVKQQWKFLNLVRKTLMPRLTLPLQQQRSLNPQRENLPDHLSHKESHPPQCSSSASGTAGPVGQHSRNFCVTAGRTKIILWRYVPAQTIALMKVDGGAFFAHRGPQCKVSSGLFW